MSVRHGRWLWLLTALFAVRVVAQPAALAVAHPLLPPFEAWHSATVPYGLLVASQIVILAAMATTSWSVTRGTLSASRRAGLIMLGVGAVYFSAMLVRLALGLTVCQESRWFTSRLPTVFHLVLASFLLVTGHSRLGYGERQAIGRKRRYGLEQH